MAFDVLTGRAQNVKMVIFDSIGHIISFCRTLKHNFSVNITGNSQQSTLLLTLFYRVHVLFHFSISSFQSQKAFSPSFTLFHWHYSFKIYLYPHYIAPTLVMLISITFLFKIRAFIRKFRINRPTLERMQRTDMKDGVCVWLCVCVSLFHCVWVWLDYLMFACMPKLHPWFMNNKFWQILLDVFKIGNCTIVLSFQQGLSLRFNPSSFHMTFHHSVCQKIINC